MFKHFIKFICVAHLTETICLFDNAWSDIWRRRQSMYSASTTVYIFSEIIIFSLAITLSKPQYTECWDLQGPSRKNKWFWSPILNNYITFFSTFLCTLETICLAKTIISCFCIYTHPVNSKFTTWQNVWSCIEHKIFNYM